MNNRTLIFIGTSAFLLFILIFVFGLFLGRAYMQPKKTITQNIDDKKVETRVDDTYEAGWEAASQALIDSGRIAGLDRPLTSLNGVVLSVNSNELTINTSDLKKKNPLGKDLPETRTITLTKNTEIYERVLKTQEEMQAEQDAYQQKRREYQEAKRNGGGENLSVPEIPSRFVDKEIAVSEVKENSRVLIINKEVDLEYLETINPQMVIILTNK